MSGLACHFCAHVNPEGSKACNECGSPLHLALCSRCEAINVVWAKGCSQCGAPLSSGGTEEMATLQTTLAESSQSSEAPPRKVEPVPIAFAERLDALLADLRVISHEPQTSEEDRPSQAAAPNADPASHGDAGRLNSSPVEDRPSQAAASNADPAGHGDEG